MEMYNRGEINENDPVSIDDSEETHQENSDRTETEESQDEEFEDVDEIDEDEMDEDSVNGLMAKSSAQTRCAILHDQVKVLKLDNDLLRSREYSFKQRLAMYDQDNKALNTRIMESEKEAAKLENEIEIIRSKAQARYSTLEKTYRELCSRLASAEEVNQKMRYTINDLNTRNRVLEELVETKTEALAELETRIQHLHKLPEGSQNGNTSSYSQDKLGVLQRKLFATERQMNIVVSDLSKMISYRFNSKDLVEGESVKYFDYKAMLEDYNQKCVRLKELEVMVDNSEYIPKIRLLEDKVRLLTKKLKQRSKLMLEKDKKMVEFYATQADDLRNVIKEKELETSWRKEEFEKLINDNKSLQTQLDLKNASLIGVEEELQKTKAQLQDIVRENDGLKKIVNNHLDNEGALKAELQASMDRENTHVTTLKNYMCEMDLKLKNLELELAHNKEVASAARRHEQEMALAHQRELERTREHDDQQKEKDGKMDETFKNALLDEMTNLKQLVTSLEKSKKEQQQINNLILTLRHQNDTVLNTLKEENKNTLNSFSERNRTSLSELKEENSKIVATLTEKITSVVESLSKREDEMTEQINRQFETLKTELKSVQPEYGGGQVDPDPAEQQGEADREPGLEEKYRKLKESFRNTTASLLRKEKILLDSLKKTVLECHTYKEKLHSLSGSAHEPKTCNCASMAKPRDSKAKQLANCWCSSKSNLGLRQEIVKRAVACETAALDSMKKSLNKRRKTEAATSSD
ncbi:hypothetical protein MACJ_004026 [Theileria orientalis]|uniref:Uncharacterized protein n=1 Tax=Theileria orientalis TaxID=68886 RepID=A0A976SKZ8_THEOR|nr:hypothetical protein MACJ_004026 [Theileria orientalis]